MSRAYSPAQLAEHKGSGIAEVALNAMRTAEDQGERVRALQNAILDLYECPRRDQAAAGFAGLLVCYLERGLGVAT
ncbi:MAG: hypothetical protein ACREVW_04260 [Burkholderiales bacterium]